MENSKSNTLIPVQFLNDLDLNLDFCGKKAAHLHRLMNAGYSIPPGFIIFPDTWVTGEDADLWKQWIDRIGGFPVAVRSSGNLEDLEDSSFAGQYQSFLNISNIQDFIKRVADCREAENSDTLRAYLSKKGIDYNKSRAESHLAVLVQKMVPSRFAGVGFSIHPMTGIEENALVEVCEGLGEKLVSGHISPTQYTLNLENGSVIEKKIGSEQAQLSLDVLRNISHQLLSVQSFFGTPQDIEWAIDKKDQLWILQSRPITRIHWREDVDEFTNADFKDGGVSARVCTPLMYSLYRDAIQRSMPAYFREIRLLKKIVPTEKQVEVDWIRTFYGRPYWNASAVKKCLQRVPGFDEESFDRDLGIQKKYGPEGPIRVSTRLSAIVPMIPVAIALERQYERQFELIQKQRDQFEASEKAFLNRIELFKSISNQEFIQDLKKVIQEFYLQTECSYFKTVYNNSNAQTDFKSFIRKLDQKISGQTSVMKLMSGLSNVSHLDLQRGLISLYSCAKKYGINSPEWKEARSLFFKSNYFHSDAELDISVPRWVEIPDRVNEMVEGMLKSGAKPMDPDESIHIQKKEFFSELNRVKERISRTAQKNFIPFGSIIQYGRLKNLSKHLKRVRTYLSYREEMRERSTRCYHIVRQYFLEAGLRLRDLGKLESENQIFMLYHDEILASLEGRVPQSQIIALCRYRTEMYRGYRNLVPPNELGKNVVQSALVDPRGPETGKRILTGVGCSPGSIEGTVRVIHSIDEIDQIKSGDILVTRFTDPGWTPVLGLASGIVTEVGGMLSHAAVISREYGIPAVLNLPGITKVVSSGMKVRINGTTGQVELL